MALLRPMATASATPPVLRAAADVAQVSNLRVWSKLAHSKSFLKSDLSPQKEKRKRIEAYLDQGSRAAWLKDERIATLGAETLKFFDGMSEWPTEDRNCGHPADWSTRTLSTARISSRTKGRKALAGEAARAWAHLATPLGEMGEADIPKFRDLFQAIRSATISSVSAASSTTNNQGQPAQ